MIDYRETEEYKMVQLGVSVYPDLSPIEEIEAYLKLASQYGFTRVFSSMFSVEDTNENIIKYFKEFIDIAHRYGIQVSLDVNPMFLKKLGVTPDDISLFHEIGCDIIRMDMSYGLEGDLQLLKNPYGIAIEFNASVGLDLESLLANGVDKERILTCHNFYPQRYTAVKWQDFLNINEHIAKYGIRIGAFISSHAPNTHGVWDAKYGLPTCEIHRDMPIDLQLRHILATKNVTDILIGNAYATEEEFKAIRKVLDTPPANFDDNPIMQMIAKMKPNFGKSQIVLKVDLDEGITDLEKEILMTYSPHFDIGDSSEWIIRSRFPRTKYSKDGVPVRPCAKDHFTKGDILIVNNNYQHYSGEVQIALMDMENDGQRNLVGSLDENEQRLLDFITSEDIMVFVDKNSD